MRAEYPSILLASIPVVDCIFCLFVVRNTENHSTSQDSPIRDMTEFSLCLEDKELFSPLKNFEDRKGTDNRQTH